LALLVDCLGGPIVDLQDNSGITPLHAACSSGQNQMTKLLLKYNANPNAKDKSGDTALHHAAQIQVQRYSYQDPIAYQLSSLLLVF
jgi:ankyrin repeat protein